MKSLAASERYGWSRYVAHQAYYSLVGRDYEWELMPLALDQGVSARWCGARWAGAGSPAKSGAASRCPRISRLHEARPTCGPPVADEYLYNVVDALDEVAEETGKSVPQIALNWLLQRPTVANVIVGARNENSCARTSAPSAGPDAGADASASTTPAPCTLAVSVLAPAADRTQSAARVTGV